jgi:hypothetical protein
VKLNLLQDYFGAILMERSDRQSWTGDAHPAQAAALVAFGNRDFVKANLDRTATGDNGIESHSLYWILSLLDYYRYSGDTATLRQHLANAQAKLEHANQIYADPPISFYGWDERLGAGFEDPNSTPETKRAYRMLFIRACREFADSLKTIGETATSETFQKMADERIAELRADGHWPDPLGLHAAADAVNAGFTTRAEQAQLFDLASRKLIAPTRVYTNFTGGIYAVYRCRQSVRVRVNHIRGDNAVLSGLFFDPPGKE